VKGKPNRVSSKTKLATQLGISRQSLYAFMRLPDSPPARNGYYSVPEWRRYITRRRGEVKFSEKEALQIAVLKVRLERERFELNEFRQLTRRRIFGELSNAFEFAFQRHVSELRRLVDTLPPRLAGCSASEIHAALDQELQRAFDRCRLDVLRQTGQKLAIQNRDESKDTIVPFRKAVAAG
jgi:hypothetical protein